MILSSIIQRMEGIVQSEIDGETVMMSIENGAYYGLDTIASRIWTLIETPQSAQTICDQLQLEYEVDDDQCKDDVLYFINEMAEHNIIQVNA